MKKLLKIILYTTTILAASSSSALTVYPISLMTNMLIQSFHYPNTQISLGINSILITPTGGNFSVATTIPNFSAGGVLVVMTGSFQFTIPVLNLLTTQSSPTPSGSLQIILSGYLRTWNFTTDPVNATVQSDGTLLITNPKPFGPPDGSIVCVLENGQDIPHPIELSIVVE